jgi:hypothetical protein
VAVADTAVGEEDQALVVDPVEAEDPVVDEVERADVEAMVQQTAPSTPNYMQAQKLTDGPVVLMSPKSMVVIPVATKYRDTEIQQPAQIQKEEPKR